MSTSESTPTHLPWTTLCQSRPYKHYARVDFTTQSGTLDLTSGVNGLFFFLHISVLINYFRKRTFFSSSYYVYIIVSQRSWETWVACTWVTANRMQIVPERKPAACKMFKVFLMWHAIGCYFSHILHATGCQTAENWYTYTNTHTILYVWFLEDVDVVRWFKL